MSSFEVQYENVFAWNIFKLEWIPSVTEWAVVAVIAWLLDLQLPIKSVTITTDVVSSNLDQVSGFLRVLRFPPRITLTTTM
jgi:hypothetical protein